MWCTSIAKYSKIWVWVSLCLHKELTVLFTSSTWPLEEVFNWMANFHTGTLAFIFGLRGGHLTSASKQYTSRGGHPVMYATIYLEGWSPRDICIRLHLEVTTFRTCVAHLVIYAPIITSWSIERLMHVFVFCFMSGLHQCWTVLWFFKEPLVLGSWQLWKSQNGPVVGLWNFGF